MPVIWEKSVAGSRKSERGGKGVEAIFRNPTLPTTITDNSGAGSFPNVECPVTARRSGVWNAGVKKTKRK